MDGVDRVDFDECLLPEDSWVRELGYGEYEVEEFWKTALGRRPGMGDSGENS